MTTSIELKTMALGHIANATTFTNQGYKEAAIQQLETAVALLKLSDGDKTA